MGIPRRARLFFVLTTPRGLMLIPEELEELCRDALALLPRCMGVDAGMNVTLVCYCGNRLELGNV